MRRQPCGPFLSSPNYYTTREQEEKTFFSIKNSFGCKFYRKDNCSRGPKVKWYFSNLFFSNFKSQDKIQQFRLKMNSQQAGSLSVHNYKRNIFFLTSPSAECDQLKVREGRERPRRVCLGRGERGLLLPGANIKCHFNGSHLEHSRIETKASQFVLAGEGPPVTPTYIYLYIYIKYVVFHMFPDLMCDCEYFRVG